MNVRNIATKTLQYGILTGLAVTAGVQGYANFESSNKFKQKVQETAPQRYEKALENEPKFFFAGANDAYWEKQVRLMEDSIARDSIAKKAYFEGAQMVRDSIANAAKN